MPFWEIFKKSRESQLWFLTHVLYSKCATKSSHLSYVCLMMTWWSQMVEQRGYIKKKIITLLWSSWLTIILHSLSCFLNVHCESPANRESLSEKISPKIFLIMQKLNSVIILSCYMPINWKLQHTPCPSEALLSLNVSSAG